MFHPSFLTRVLPLGVLCLLLTVIVAGCDSSSPGDDDNCEVFDACEATLELTLLESEAHPPANVSILFKIDTADDLPIAGLTPSNFDIFENEQIVSRFEAKQSILPKTGQFQYSIALLLDLSGSVVESENLAPLKEAARQFVDAIMVEPDDPRYGEVELGIWWFDGQEDITQLVDFTPSPDTLKEGIDSITPSITVDNSTNLYGAVVQGLIATDQRVDTYHADDILAAGSLVIFTDGTDQANRTPRNEALETVEAAGDDLSIFSIGLGGEIDTTTLEAVGKNGFVSASNIDELVDRFEEIGDLVRDEANSYYLLEYCSPKRGGENRLTIRAESGEYVGLLSTGFDAGEFTSGCSVSE